MQENRTCYVNNNSLNVSFHHSSFEAIVMIIGKTWSFKVQKKTSRLNIGITISSGGVFGAHFRNVGVRLRYFCLLIKCLRRVDRAGNGKLGQISNYLKRSIFICLVVRDVRNHLFHWLLNG